MGAFFLEISLTCYLFNLHKFFVDHFTLTLSIYLLINYNSNRDAAIEVQRLIHQMGRRSEIIQADVGKISDHEKLVQYTVETLGSVDILINNAGITRVSDILAEKVIDYDIVMNTNLRGPHFLTQRVANYMIDHSIRGAIVFTLSILFPLRGGILKSLWGCKHFPG